MTRSYPALALSAGKPLRISPMCGDWLNADRGSGPGMLGVTLIEQEGSLWVRGLGLARPVAYAWHRVRTASFAPDPAANQAWGFLVDYDFGFMRTIVAGYYKTSVLVATTYNTFHDNSERTPYWTREFFHRRTLGEPPTTAVPREVTRDRDRSQGTAHGHVDPAPMIGRWINFDREAPDITGVTVRAEGDRLAISIDDRGLPPGGSGAEGRRGVIDDRGLAPGGSGAEGRRGVIDDRGLPPGGSGAEGRRGVIDQAAREGVRRWPALQGVAMAERTSGGPAIGFLAVGDLFPEQGDGPHAGALCAYLNRGLLTIDTYVTDVRASTNVMTRVHLHLAEGAPV